MRKELLIGGISMTLATMALAVPTSATDTTDAVDSVSIGVPISCSMEGTGMNSHTASVPNGTYQADIGTTTLKAYCNDDEGFAIFAVGYTGDEIGGTNSTKLVGTNGSIVTGTATSGDTSNWAMKLTTNSGATYAITLDNGFSSYSSVPASYTKVAHRDSGTDIGTGATGASLTTTYAAFISKTESADIYNGKVKFTLVHPENETPAQPQPCEAGKICYHANTTSVQGQMGDQSLLKKDWSSCAHTDNRTYCSDDDWNEIDINTLPELPNQYIENATLWAPNFKRTGYGFAGWNTSFDYSGTNYGPNQTITTPADIQTNGLSLYARWIPSQGTLQNWNGCSSMNIGDVTALTDNRDNDTYAVAKLADGKCWTIENLRLDNAPELTVSNTHNPSLPLNNSWYYLNRQGTLVTSNHLSAPSDPTSTNPDTAWCSDSMGPECYNQSMLATNNTIGFTTNTSSNYSTSNNVYSYGNYYNWYSATAGHGKYASDSGYVAPGDICPAGWHLPTGKDANGDFGVLDIAIGGTGTDQSTIEASNRWCTYPTNFIYSGYVVGSYVNSRDYYGEYWSSSRGNLDMSAHALYFYGGIASAYGNNVGPGTYAYSKNQGLTVRCISGT